jgi:hypothetical protein
MSALGQSRTKQGREEDVSSAPTRRTKTEARMLLSAATRGLRWANASRAAEITKTFHVSGALKTIDDRSSLPLKSSPLNFRRERRITRMRFFLRVVERNLRHHQNFERAGFVRIY